MQKEKRIVIFSHGMGVFKDARGLFTEISEFFKEHGIKPILFDYNKINQETKEVTVTSFTKQTKVLQEVIDKTNKEYPDHVIDILAHSQGAVMVALAKLTNIRKVILVAPFFHTDIEDVAKRHKKSVDELNFTEASRRKRSDGSTTITLPEYYTERFSTPIFSLYNKLAFKKDLTIINASEDEIMDSTNLTKIYNAYILNLHSNHDFTEKTSREKLKNHLIKIIK